MLISGVRSLKGLIVGVLVTLVTTGTTAMAQPSSADLVGILQAVVAIREGQGSLAGDGPWHVAVGDAAAIELARAGNIPHRVAPSGGHTRCVDGYDVTVDVQSAGPNAARVNVGLSCLNATGFEAPQLPLRPILRSRTRRRPVDRTLRRLLDHHAWAAAA